MTVSSSVDYADSVSDLLTASLMDCGALGIGESASGELMDVAMSTANRMIKAWQAEGLYLWKTTEIDLILGYAQASYLIGPSGNHASTTIVQTTIATAAASGDATVTVTSDTGMSTGDYIGVELDDGTLQWTTINGAPVADVVTLTDVLTDSSASGNYVYTYTTKANRPLELITARLYMGDSDTETSLRIGSRQEYMALSNKSTSATPNMVYFDPQTVNAKLWVWPACGDVRNRIKMSVRDPIMDLDTVADDFDFPVEWLEAIEFNTAVRLSPKLGRPLTQDLILLASNSKDRVSDFDREQTSIFFRMK